MLQLLKNPIEPIFMNLLNETNDKVILCSPFIKKDIIKKILHNKKDNTNITVITSSKLFSILLERLSMLCMVARISSMLEDWVRTFSVVLAEMSERSPEIPSMFLLALVLFLMIESNKRMVLFIRYMV